MRLGGSVLADSNGPRLRQRRRYWSEWEAGIPLLHTETGFLKPDSQ
jgi:hypothetical protein